MNILKKFSGEINKDDYKCKYKFFRKRATNSFIHQYLTLQSYADIISHNSCFQFFKFNYSRQRYLNIKTFVIKVAIAKISSALCKLAVVAGKWDKVFLEYWSCHICSLAGIESELGFLFHCPSCNHSRKPLRKYVL